MFIKNNKKGVEKMSNIKILIVDDDQNICELLRLYVEKDGYEAIVVNDGAAALDAAEEHNPKLILLDIMLPKLDGWQVCRELRKTSDVPIIMLTAKGETFDKVLGLELGADDYISKPFDAKEVMARIKAVLRRTYNEEENQKVVKYDKLEINLTNYELIVDGKQIDTPPKLLDEVWGFDYYGDSRTVDVHVKRLREKLEDISDKWSLKTVWGVGYKFETK